MPNSRTLNYLPVNLWSPPNIQMFILPPYVIENTSQHFFFFDSKEKFIVYKVFHCSFEVIVLLFHYLHPSPTIWLRARLKILKDRRVKVINP